MVSHFHYDPVWWNTQAAYTSEWDLWTPTAPRERTSTHNGFSLVDAHLKLALRDPDYCFVLAELDYLKPYLDIFPENRAVPAPADRTRAGWSSSAAPTTSRTPT